MDHSTANKDLNDASVWDKETYFAYGVVMFFILTIGFVGNVLTLLVLQRREHRNRIVTPLMINLAFADTFIVVFGYPVAISAKLAGKILDRGGHCEWVGFVNGTVGITSIITLAEMAIVSYRGLKSLNATERLSSKQVFLLIGGAWMYGGLAMSPPLLGWNRFVLTLSKVSCCPDWVAKSASAIAYNLLLVTVAFVLPLFAIIVCYHKIYCLVRQNHVPGNIEVQIRQRKSKLRFVRMTAMSVLAFVLSWSPYCFVSLAATITGQPVITPGKAEVAEMLAKASVIYNPIVYTVMNRRFRVTLMAILHFRWCSAGFHWHFNVLHKNIQIYGITSLRESPHQLKRVEELHFPVLVKRIPLG